MGGTWHWYSLVACYVLMDWNPTIAIIFAMRVLLFCFISRRVTITDCISGWLRWDHFARTGKIGKKKRWTIVHEGEAFITLAGAVERVNLYTLKPVDYIDLLYLTKTYLNTE